MIGITLNRLPFIVKPCGYRCSKPTHAVNHSSRNLTGTVFELFLSVFLYLRSDLQQRARIIVPINRALLNTATVKLLELKSTST